MAADKRKAAPARHSLPNAPPANKQLPHPPTTPAATNKRSLRHSTSTSSADTRQSKARKTQQLAVPPTEQDEQREAGYNGDIEAAFSALCGTVSSLAALQSQHSAFDHSATINRSQSILSSLHRLSPPATLSPRHPPPAAVLPAIHSAADQLVSIAQSMQTNAPTNGLLQSRLQQLQSTSLPLSSSDTYALLLSASITLCQLLALSATSHTSQVQAGGVRSGELSDRYVERVSGLFGAELDALRKEGESSVGAACLPLLAQSVQHIITAHLPISTSGDERTLLSADLQQGVAAQQVK